MQEGRIELLQRMPIFGGVHADSVKDTAVALSKK
jgi:hypothetical protein